MEGLPVWDVASQPELSAALRAAFDEAGVIFCRGLMPAERRLQVQQDLGTLLSLQEAECFQCDETLPDSDAHVESLSRRLIHLAARVPTLQSAVYDALSHLPSLHAIVSDRRILKPIQTLLSPMVSIHPRLILLMAMPQNEWHLPLWHQDWYYNEGPHDTLTLYAPLQRTTAENGSLLIAPGAHRRGVLPHGQFDHGHQTKWNTLDPDVVQTFDSVVETELEPGDVLLFNSLVPHSARLNRSSAVRFVINLRFYNLADPQFVKDEWRIKPIAHARTALARKVPA